VVARDGTILVTRFGHGDSGGILYLKPDGTSGTIAGLDGKRRRIGLAIGTDGTIYESFFDIDEAMHASHGGIARVQVDGGEVDVASGLMKPVGVVVRDDGLVVSDQQENRIVRIDPKSAEARPLVEKVEAPDLLCTGRDGDLFVGSRKGVLHRVSRDGAVVEIARVSRSIRGVAYDPERRVVFFVERGAREPAAAPVLHALFPY
jgi:hypothetical protein